MSVDGNIDEKLFWPHTLTVKTESSTAERVPVADRPFDYRNQLPVQYDDGSADQSKWSPAKHSAEAERQSTERQREAAEV